MKLLKVLLLLLSSIFVNCQVIDWSNVTPIHRFFNVIGHTRANDVPSRARRIVGGRIANPFQMPYQAALAIRYPGSTGQCSGSLITTKTVLTAAHCLYGSSFTTVILGALSLNEQEPSRQTFHVDNNDYRIHELYDDFTLLNDIALLILPTHAFLTREVQMVSLAFDPSENYRDKIGRVGGWGRISDVTMQVSENLQYIEVPIMPNQECAKSFPNVITKGNICTTSLHGRSACNGDSGSALTTQYYYYEKPVQIGIVSFGSMFGCEQGAPVVYTKVAEYIPFIMENVK
jgi:secreted trypsin-like serine protease